MDGWMIHWVWCANRKWFDGVSEGKKRLTLGISVQHHFSITGIQLRDSLSFNCEVLKDSETKLSLYHRPAVAESSSFSITPPADVISGWRFVTCQSRDSLSICPCISSERMRRTLEVMLVLQPRQISEDEVWQEDGEQQHQKTDSWALMPPDTLPEENKVHYTNTVPRPRLPLTGFVGSAQQGLKAAVKTWQLLISSPAAQLLHLYSSGGCLCTYDQKSTFTGIFHWFITAGSNTLKLTSHEMIRCLLCSSLEIVSLWVLRNKADLIHFIHLFFSLFSLLFLIFPYWNKLRDEPSLKLNGPGQHSACGACSSEMILPGLEASWDLRRSLTSSVKAEPTFSGLSSYCIYLFKCKSFLC